MTISDNIVLCHLYCVSFMDESMEDEDKKIIFFEYFKKGSQLDHCPFLYEWFKPKLEKISKIPEMPEREGIPKGEKIPWPRLKSILMLLRLVYPRLSLKKYAGNYDISYGTVRNWNIATDYNEKQAELLFGYSDLFCKRLFELIESHDDDLKQIE